ncbi:Hypothetical protein CINCED_3A005036 [Cinara cedri]|uniref:Uncharacterized protein n=1 Tax=Cinara cedri TaxID=506608 RepID=A0A5E4MXX1_9HEMI|nr:Hypothetical protein CINCED_3A005036 [Cinara cedri]
MNTGSSFYEPILVSSDSESEDSDSCDRMNSFTRTNNMISTPYSPTHTPDVALPHYNGMICNILTNLYGFPSDEESTWIYGHHHTMMAMIEASLTVINPQNCDFFSIVITLRLMDGVLSINL